MITFILFWAVVYLIVKCTKIGVLEQEILRLKRRMADLEHNGSAAAHAPHSLRETGHPKPEPCAEKTAAPAAEAVAAAHENVYTKPTFLGPEPTVPLTDEPPVRTAEKPASAAKPFALIQRVDWERFAGASLFAWLGGFALFLGLAFFVKYSIDAGYITPLMRVILGLLAGGALVASGVLIKDRGVKITSDTLCACGIAALYMSVYAAGSFYGFIGGGSAFFVMFMVSAAAFYLSVQLNARVIAILGLAGGFLTPVLLSTGQDRTLAFFSYIGLLDVVALMLSGRMRWPSLSWLSGLGTLLLALAWYGKFFSVSSIWPAVAVFSTFPVLYGIMAFVPERYRLSDDFAKAVAPGLVAAGMLVAWNMAGFSGLNGRPVPVFILLLLVNAVLGALTWRDAPFHETWRKIVSLLNFVVLLRWTYNSVTPETFGAALVFLVLFSLISGVYPLILRTKGKIKVTCLDGVAAFLCLLPLVSVLKTCGAISWFFWPAVAVIACAGLAVAAVTGVLALALGGLLLVFIVMLVWLFTMPAQFAAAELMFAVVALAAVFAAAGILLKKYAARMNLPAENPALEHMAVLAMLPAFTLIFFATLHLRPLEPHTVFSAALAIDAMLLASAVITGRGAVAYIALAGTFLVQFAWRLGLEPGLEFTGMAWYGGFLAVFLFFPFLFRARVQTLPQVWITAALAGPAQFTLMYYTGKTIIPALAVGFVPAAFALVYLGVTMFEAARREEPARQFRLAWFGGITLLFITLIFPVQFEKEWLTIGWGLEGAALLWLYGRIRHDGLKTAAYVLLAASFARLALNGAVLGYHPRQAVPVVNWYLYTYGLVAGACFIGARLWPRDAGELFGTKPRAVLAGMGVILLFLLLNIEIADYFSSGPTLTFEFSGNLVRDMAYTLGWGFFALWLLVAGLYGNSRPARIAAVALMSVTALKLFFHDLWALGQLYRVFAFVGLAALLIAVSYLYQKYVRGTDETSRS